MSTRVICVLCVVLLVALPLGGCGQVAEKAAQKAVEKSTGISVDEEGDQVTVKGKDGNEVTVSGEGSAKLPDGWPDNVPVYKNGELKTSASAKVNGKTQMMINLETKDAADQVGSWYKDELAANNWKIISDISNNSDGKSTVILSFGKTETDSEPAGVISVNEGDSGTTAITQTLTQ